MTRCYKNKFQLGHKISCLRINLCVKVQLKKEEIYNFSTAAYFKSPKAFLQVSIHGPHLQVAVDPHLNWLRL